MQIINCTTKAVDTTAAGTEILSSADARLATTRGMQYIILNPSVDIVLIETDASMGEGISIYQAGSVANSPLVCPAGVPTVVSHSSGQVLGISTAGTSTVKRALALVP